MARLYSNRDRPFDLGPLTIGSISGVGTRQRDFIRRVIGFPGETLELRCEQVYITASPSGPTRQSGISGAPGVKEHQVLVADGRITCSTVRSVRH